MIINHAAWPLRSRTKEEIKKFMSSIRLISRDINSIACEVSYPRNRVGLHVSALANEVISSLERVIIFDERDYPEIAVCMLVEFKLALEKLCEQYEEFAVLPFFTEIGSKRNVIDFLIFLESLPVNSLHKSIADKVAEKPVIEANVLEQKLKKLDNTFDGIRKEVSEHNKEIQILKTFYSKELIRRKRFLYTIFVLLIVTLIFFLVC
jgi:archaellum component FlaC